VRLVIDTNVLVSALLKPGSVPDRLLEAIWARELEVVYDARIHHEWARVVARRKFRAVPEARRERLLEQLVSRGRELGAVPAWDGEMIDDDDRMFVEVARAADAVIVTGNAKHFPDSLPVEVTRPAALLGQLTDA